MKVSPDGEEIWSDKFNSDENYWDRSPSLVIDSINNIYLTGTFNNTNDKGICYTLKYSNSGKLEWINKFDTPQSTLENGKKIFLDDSNNVFVCGNLYDTTNGWNYFLLKINQSKTTSIEIDAAVSNQLMLNQNYPNPFNPITKIDFHIPSSDFVRLEVFDAIGSKVKILLNRELSSGNHSINFDASNLSSGIYFYRLSTNSYNIVKKALLLK